MRVVVYRAEIGERQMERASLSESLRKVEAEIASGHPDQALAHSQELQAWYPRALPIQRVLGEIYLALRKPREALGALDRVLAGDPEDARACCARAIVHQMHGDTMAALAWYRRACDIRPEDQALRGTYGELARSLGQPPYRPSRSGLARLYARGDLFVHAAREWEALIAETNDNLEAQVGLVETLWRARQFPVAEERCRHILANSPTCVKALLILAWIAQHGDRQEEAQRLMQRVSELDPDRRIGQLLFADEVATGDELVIRLLAGDTAVAGGQRLTGPFGQSGLISGLRPGVSRPLVQSRPQADTGAGRGQQPQVDPHVNSRPLAGHRTGAPPPVTAPLDPAQMFRETAFMIWGPDEDTREQASVRPPTAPAGGQRGDPSARSGQTVPPALLQGNAGLDETEARQAMNWVQWLQGQGAVVRDDGSGTDASLQVPPSVGIQPPVPGMNQQPANTGFPTGMPVTGWNDQAAMPMARQTMPLPAPTAEDLRSMFAELEPQTSKQPVVDADVVVSQSISQGTNGPRPASHDGDAEMDQGISSPPPAPAGSGAADPWPATDTGWMPEDHLPDHLAALRNGNAESQSWPQSGSQAAQPTNNASPVLTLENIEQQFAASGFQNFEPRPGALAEIAETGAPSGTSVTGRPAPSAPVAPPEPAAPPKPAAPAPDDYPARLALARQQREEGNMDEALVEYRAVLKNASDLFTDVLEDLRASLVAAPEHPEVHRLLGDAYIRQGDYLNALESYNRALALSQAQEQ